MLFKLCEQVQKVNETCNKEIRWALQFGYNNCTFYFRRLSADIDDTDVVVSYHL